VRASSRTSNSQVALRQPNQLRLSLQVQKTVKPKRKPAERRSLVANDDSNLRPTRAQLAEPPYADRLYVVGRGEQVTAPPIRFSSHSFVSHSSRLPPHNSSSPRFI